MRQLLAIALLSCATLANAQTVLIRGATVHTVGDQGVLNNTDVLVRDGKIAAVGSSLSAPADATTVDAKGRALTPGLFGGLSAIGVEEVSLEPTTADAGVILNHMRGRPETWAKLGPMPDPMRLVSVGRNRSPAAPVGSKL